MSRGRFGVHGGQYMSETLMNELLNLEEQYNHFKEDPEFINELNTLLKEYAGRPSLLYYAKRMTEDLGGAKIYLKREDLNHTGAHKINLACQKDGQDKSHCRNRCRPAWSGYSYRCSIVGYGM